MAKTPAHESRTLPHSRADVLPCQQGHGRLWWAMKNCRQSPYVRLLDCAYERFLGSHTQFEAVRRTRPRGSGNRQTRKKAGVRVCTFKQRNKAQIASCGQVGAYICMYSIYHVAKEENTLHKMQRLDVCMFRK